MSTCHRQGTNDNQYKDITKVQLGESVSFIKVVYKNIYGGLLTGTNMT